MAQTIILFKYTKTFNNTGAAIDMFISLKVHDSATGDDLEWDYHLTPTEISSVVAAESNITTILQQQGQLAYNAFLAQVAPTPVAQVQASPHLFTITGGVVSVT